MLVFPLLLNITQIVLSFSWKSLSHISVNFFSEFQVSGVKYFIDGATVILKSWVSLKRLKSSKEKIDYKKKVKKQGLKEWISG